MVFETMLYETMLYEVLMYKRCTNPWICTTDFLNAVQTQLCTMLAANVVPIKGVSLQCLYSYTSYNVVQIQRCMRQHCTNHILSNSYNVVNVVRDTTVVWFCKKIIFLFTNFVCLFKE